MFYYLAQYILGQTANTAAEPYLSWVRLFRYVTFRSAGAALTALALSLWLGPKVIAWLKELKFGQNYVDRAVTMGEIGNRHIDKRGVPTMGGLMIILILDFSALLWTQWNILIQLTLLSGLILCGLGFYDDYAKITQQNSKGVAGRVKLIVQFALALFTALYLWQVPATEKLITEVMVPFYKFPVLIGSTGIAAGLVLTILTIVGSSNAVNLTDGLDGLAIGCVTIVSFVFIVLTYVAGNSFFAGYLQVPYVPGAGELTVFCSAMVGAGLGFLWFNCHPAKMFMGDTGSLALGGVLGIVAVLIHQPLVLAIAGGIFVMEAGSVMMQTGYFKWTKRRTGTGQRIFLMTPIHHHFEKKGWYESQIVTRFYILGLLFGLVALATLKIR